VQQNETSIPCPDAATDFRSGKSIAARFVLFGLGRSAEIVAEIAAVAVVVGVSSSPTWEATEGDRRFYTNTCR
jgi:hypothetical protein